MLISSTSWSLPSLYILDKRFLNFICFGTGVRRGRVRGWRGRSGVSAVAAGYDVDVLVVLVLAVARDVQLDLGTIGSHQLTLQEVILGLGEVFSLVLFIAAFSQVVLKKEVKRDVWWFTQKLANVGYFSLESSKANTEVSKNICLDFLPWWAKKGK